MTTNVEVVHVGENLPEDLSRCSKEVSVILAEASLAISALLAANFPNVSEDDLSITLVLLDNREEVKRENQINLLFTEEVNPYRLLDYLAQGLGYIGEAIKAEAATQETKTAPRRGQLKEDLQEAQGSPCYPLGRTMH